MAGGAVGHCVGVAGRRVVGGWVFGTFNFHGWRYIGSLGIGLGGMAIALSLKPVPLSIQRA